MSEPKDWVTEAAREITAGHEESSRGLFTAIVVELIKKHCPYKPDTDYEEVRESPLLLCIDCKNTESPAGAMARHFNHGRCLHCGGYFKVVRA